MYVLYYQFLYKLMLMFIYPLNAENKIIVWNIMLILFEIFIFVS